MVHYVRQKIIFSESVGQGSNIFSLSKGFPGSLTQSHKDSLLWKCIPAEALSSSCHRMLVRLDSKHDNTEEDNILFPMFVT